MTDEASRFSAPLLLALLPEDALVLFPLSALDADAPLREALPLALLPLALAEVAALGMLLGTGLLALEMVTIAQSAASTVSRQERGGRDSRPIPVVKRHVRYLLDDAAPDTGRRVVDYRLNLISP
ncbi:hypothetical protein JOE11_000223 [Robbsia andropogonis]|nr:hypothetical protein [Robbsia andropogonis]MCP1118779.1 hypothetical protein [Robbsia andropogonis]MCP1128246.1 hypothetical protein [Robbsia andropogonis]